MQISRKGKQWTPTVYRVWSHRRDSRRGHQKYRLVFLLTDIFLFFMPLSPIGSSLFLS